MEGDVGLIFQNNYIYTKVVRNSVMKVEKQSTTSVEVPLKTSSQSLDVSFSPEVQRFREEFLAQRPSSTVTQLHQLDIRVEEVRNLTRTGHPEFSAAFKWTAAAFSQLSKPEQNSYRDEIESLSGAVVDYSRRAMRNGSIDAITIREIGAGLRSLGTESKSFNVAVEEYVSRSMKTSAALLERGDLQGAGRAITQAAALVLPLDQKRSFSVSNEVRKELQERVHDFLDVCHRNGLDAAPEVLSVNAISERLLTSSTNRSSIKAA